MFLFCVSQQHFHGLWSVVLAKYAIDETHASHLPKRPTRNTDSYGFNVSQCSMCQDLISITRHEENKNLI